MHLSVRRPWAWGAVGAALAVVLGVVYLGLRTSLSGQPLTPWEVLLLVFPLPVISACLVAWASQRALRSVLQEVSDHIAALRQNPAAPPLHPLSAELQSLHAEL